MRQNKYRGRETPIRELRCFCGGALKRTKRKNYPFGKNSKSRSSFSYSCKSCNNKSLPEIKKDKYPKRF